MSNRMKTKTSTYIAWVIVLVILAGSIFVISQGRQKEQERLKAEYQDVPEASPSQETATQQNAELPYKNIGPDAADDSFFIKGNVGALSSLVEKDKNATVVWVSASWCEICHAMRPFVWKSANKYADKVAIKEIDFQDNYNNIVLPHKLFGTPAFLVLDKNGQLAFSFSGATQSMFEQQLEKASKL